MDTAQVNEETIPILSTPQTHVDSASKGAPQTHESPVLSITWYQKFAILETPYFIHQIIAHFMYMIIALMFTIVSISARSSHAGFPIFTYEATFNAFFFCQFMVTLAAIPILVSLLFVQTHRFGYPAIIGV
jgi:hypothetical protein